MRNNDFISNFIAHALPEKAVCNHLMKDGDILYNYSTEILRIDWKSKTYYFNTRKYSRTTSKIQSYIERILSYRTDWKIVRYEGDYCYYWNAGYMGAENWKMSDIR